MNKHPRHFIFQAPLHVALPLIFCMPLVSAAWAQQSSSSAPMDMSTMPGMDMPASATTASPPPSVKPAKPTPAAPPDASMSNMQGMDHGSMPGMDMPAPATTAPSPPAATPAKPAPAASSGSSMSDMQGMDHGSMQGMDHGSMQGMDHSSMQGMNHDSMQGMDHSAMQGMQMGPMQGGRPPPDARDPDYSAGVSHDSTHAAKMQKEMGMEDDAPVGMLLIDQLEAFHGKHGNGQQWETEGWYGTDYNKLWLRTEGERSGGRLEDATVEAFWNHTVATYWSTQLGVRADAGEGPNRQWAAFGIQGLSPYWFELEATGYVGDSGRTAARLRAEYELLFTQRLILQPEFEANVYGKADPARHLGSGLSDASLGLRLRYEFSRQFAPYIGIVWTRRFGGTADFARQDGQDIFDRQWVAGFHIWF